MAPPDLLSRLRKARVFQVLVVYVGASWVILEVSDVLTDALALPAWVSPVVVILLLAGLVIVLATAWVQAHPLVTDRAAREEVPERWELDVWDLRRALWSGEIPHLTWARALVGGVVAFSLLFGAAGVYVLLTDPGPVVAPAEAEGAAPGIAVLPFDARGVDAELWGAGLVDLVGTNLDGVGGLRAIDSRTVLARWRESGLSSGGDLAGSLDVARATGARYAVLGNALGVADEVRVTARLYDLSGGGELASAQVEGSPDSVLALVDALSVDLLRELLSGREPGLAPRSLARVTTSSVPALRAFLRGEAANRRADFPAAIEAYEAALAEDSTFALAAYRLSSAYGWIQSRSAPASVRYGELAARHSDRLPSRDAALLRASEGALRAGDPESLWELDDLSTSYPDDPEIWTMLGEARWHLGPMLLVPWSDAVDAFEHAIALDSAFAPAYIHPAEAAIGSARDSARARELIDAYARVAAADARLAALRFAYELVYGDPSGVPPVFRDGGLPYTAGVLDRGGFRAYPAALELIDLTLASDGYPSGLPPDALASWRLISQALLGRVDAVVEARSVAEGAWLEALSILVSEYGVSLPDSLLAPVLAVDSTSEPARIVDATLVAARLGRQRVVDRGLALLRRLEGRLPTPAPAPPNGPPGPPADLVADAIAAYAAWRAGEPDGIERMEAAREATVRYDTEFENESLRRWLGAAHLEAGRPGRAITYLRSVNDIPLAGLLLAEAYEAAGQRERAAAAYADMVRLWEGADPDFEPAQRARRGLERTRAGG